MNQIFLLLGSNLGNKRAVLEQTANIIGFRVGKIFASSSFFETEPWGNADSTEHRRNVPKGGKPVKHIPGYGGSKGKSWHSYGGSKGKSWTQTCNQGWDWSSGAEKSSEANYSAGWRATAVEPWNQAPARASHAKQMSESQTCTKADAKGTRRQVVQWPGNPDCGDESSSAEETVVQMEQEVADVWQ
jgi:hypothetical protein